MNKTITILLAVSVLLVSCYQNGAESENFDGLLITEDFTSGCSIGFEVTEDRKLDIVLEDCSGMTEAAELFVGFINDNYSFGSVDGKPLVRKLSEMTCEEAEDGYGECTFNNKYIPQVANCRAQYYPVLLRCYGVKE